MAVITVPVKINS